LSLVPPHVKNIIQLREDLREKQKKEEKIKSSQIGVIVFMDESGTSQKCPNCYQKSESDKGTKNDLKYRQKRFLCSECGFDTYLFKPETDRVKDYNPPVNIEDADRFQHLKDIDDPDKVAAYNIAVKINDSNEIGKWENMQPQKNKNG